MAVLNKIVIQDFRNIALQELEFSPNVNCICGLNGAGKTNLLDAIYYLSMTKSAFATVEKFNFRHGCDSFSLAGDYAMPSGVISRFSVKVEDGGGKRVMRDSKPYAKISEHIGFLPIVMVSPSDSAMISESGDERRRFVHSVLSQMDTEYLSAAQQYTKLLIQRNSLLKEIVPAEDLLAAFDARMTHYASLVYERRKACVGELLPVVRQYYERISSGHGQVGIEYRSDLSAAPLDQVLFAHREKDRALRYTTAGIQRDDFIFSLDGYPIRRCGSQGQQKSFLVALKFAQYEIMKKRYGFPPMLLLDDLFDKLDTERMTSLLQMVSGEDFGQIFLSDTNRDRIGGLLDKLTSDRSYFECKDGCFEKI